RAPGGDGRAEIMAYHGGGLAVAERRDEGERVAHQIEQAEGAEIAVIGAVPAGGAAIAALVRGDDAIAGGGERRHRLAPAIGELGEAVQEEDERTISAFVAGLGDMHGEAGDAGE